MIVHASPVTQGVDVDGNTEKIGAIGAAADELRVNDMDQTDYLDEILKQLKIMNIHLSQMTDMQIDKQELVEV